MGWKQTFHVPPEQLPRHDLSYSIGGMDHALNEYEKENSESLLEQIERELVQAWILARGFKVFIIGHGYLT